MPSAEDSGLCVIISIITSGEGGMERYKKACACGGGEVLGSSFNLIILTGERQSRVFRGREV